MGQQTTPVNQGNPNPVVYPHPPPAHGAAGMYPTGQLQYMHGPMHHPMGAVQPVAYGHPPGGPYMGDGNAQVAYARQPVVMPAPVAVVAVQNPEFMSSSAKSLIIAGLVLTAIGFILCIVGEATRVRIRHVTGEPSCVNPKNFPLHSGAGLTPIPSSFTTPIMK
eukprot:TRINITY_DN40220_c0_g1_i1.p1 TRINITY_DN40220_c0_g1~~TRINITY_DN40220_c0_g1_i1.p1  ORF type:complete len:164 (-),score=1.62 TRINITY_DN40220_c0_g1_i1:575-1066(-)